MNETKDNKIGNNRIYDFSKTAFYIFVICIFSVASILFIFMAFTTKEYLVTYINEKVVVDDVVKLKENNYYKDDYLKNQSKYITTLIDSISLEYSYDLSMSNEIDYDVYYYVDAVLSIYEVDYPENVLWSEKDSLVEKKLYKNGDISYLKLDEVIDIDYNKYNQLVKDFVKDYVLITDATLKIDFHVIMDCKDDKYSDNYDRDKVISVEIPMNEQTISIVKSYNNLENEPLTVSNNVFNIFSLVYLVFGIIFLVFDVVFLYRLFVQLRDAALKRSPYQKTLDKILRTYDQIIVTAKTIPKYDGLNVIEVDTFDELLDAQEELRIPIVYFETKENQESIFIIINDNNAWVYYLKELSYVKWS